MKLTNITRSTLAIAALITMASCNGAPSASSKSSTSARDKAWTQKQRKEYMAGCLSSAKSSYENRGQVPDEAMITRICQCTGQEIEAKYGYEEASDIPAEEMRNYVMEATQKCASE